jgi:hypothetical protein
MDFAFYACNPFSKASLSHPPNRPARSSLFNLAASNTALDQPSAFNLSNLDALAAYILNTAFSKQMDFAFYACNPFGEASPSYPPDRPAGSGLFNYANLAAPDTALH